MLSWNEVFKKKYTYRLTKVKFTSEEISAQDKASDITVKYYDRLHIQEVTTTGIRVLVERVVEFVPKAYATIIVSQIVTFTFQETFGQSPEHPIDDWMDFIKKEGIDLLRPTMSMASTIISSVTALHASRIPIITPPSFTEKRES